VLRRCAMVVDEFQPETIVRLTADCPLADVTVIDRVITSHVQSGADYTSNTITPTFPDGLDVECIGAKAFARLVARPLTVREREHVTMGIYSRPDDFSLNSVVQEHDRSALRWTVDVAEDLEFVRAVYNELYIGNPRFEQEDVMELIRTQPALNRTGDDVARNAGSAQ
jgi:spore coat polysaccharide biosynthesis protein SpsF